MSEAPTIISAHPIYPYTVKVGVSDGLIKIVDFEPFLKANCAHEAISPYLDPFVFTGVAVVNGDLVWGEDWDIQFSAATVRAGEIPSTPITESA